jgi:DNA topoisomerase-2
MAQSFKNSLPLLEEIGQFGSLRSPEAGAARYISTKTTPNFRLIYKDFELLEQRHEEGTQIEPAFFLPIIPTVLLNGSSGIAVGFATNILNRNPIDLIDACMNVLNGKKVPKLLPWWKDFSGPVAETDNNNQYVMRGVYKVANTTTVEISELPPSVTYQKYEAHLNALQEKGTIYSYDDNCSGGINYTIKFSRATLADLIKKGKLDSTLKMAENETENLTTLDENGKLKIFSNVVELVEYFVNFRLGYYDKRKAYLIDKITKELVYLSNRAKFIKLIIEGKLKLNNRPKAEIISDLEKLKFDKINDSYQYLLSMAISSLTKEVYEQLLKEVDEKTAELKRVKETEPIDMYKLDLTELKKSLKNIK